MSLKTRIDGRSSKNGEFTLYDKEGEELATVAIEGNQSATLSIDTSDGIYIGKPNGWDNKEVGG